jgi:ferritin-like metal-binding protein YciE
MATKNKNSKIKKAKDMNLGDLLINKLCALYYVENAMVKSLPKLAKAATDADLKNGFVEHLDETRGQVDRLEEIFSLLDMKPKKLQSEAMDGLVADGEWIIKNVGPEETRDANLARAAQLVEHYEITAYSAAISWAEELGLGEISEILKETLAEEENADEKLETVGSKIQKEIVDSMEEEAEENED